jgi:putative glutamine amidotransferase
MWPRDRKAHRFPLSYAEAIKKSGGAPEVHSAFPLSPGEEPPDAYSAVTGIDPSEVELAGDVSGLVLTGGGDIDPADYGQKPHPRTYNVSQRRDRFEYALLDRALERDIPVLAICRGMQVLNVHLGGTLQQHLGDRPDLLDHDRDRPRAEPAHGFAAEEDSLIAQALGSDDTSVNSHHHQALKAVAKSLVVTGWAEDGVIEAVESDEHTWVVGVQWHPEAMAPINHEEMRLFETFVESAREYASASPASARTA